MTPMASTIRVVNQSFKDFHLETSNLLRLSLIVLIAAPTATPIAKNMICNKIYAAKASISIIIHLFVMKVSFIL